MELLLIINLSLVTYRGGERRMYTPGGDECNTTADEDFEDEGTRPLVQPTPPMKFTVASSGVAMPMIPPSR